MRKIDSTWKASPSSGDRIDGMPAVIQDVKTTFSDHIAFEHRVGVGTDDGGHLPGSALTYTGVSTSVPAYKPDGLTALDAQDLGRLWYQTDTGLLMTLTAYSPVTWTPCSSGGGSGGGTNYLPYALVSGASGWNIDTGSSRWQFGSPAWDTSVVLAGKSGTTGNGGGSLKTTFTGTFDSAVDKLYSSTFFVDQSDIGQAWKIQFTAKFVSAASYTDDSLEVFLWDVTNSIEIATGVTLKAMSLQPQTIQAWVYPSTSQQYRLRIRPNQNVAANFQLNIADVTVAPQQILSVPAVGGWIPYTPTMGGLGSGSMSTLVAYYRRVGDNCEINFAGTKDGTNGTGASAVTLSLPVGLTAAGGKSSFITSTIQWRDAVASNNWKLAAALQPGVGLNYVTFQKMGTLLSITGTDLSQTSDILGSFTIPIAQWSSSIQVSAEAVEYASNSASTDVQDLTSFYNGMDGSSLKGCGVSSSARYRRVRFNSAIKPSDRIELQLYESSLGTWMPYTGYFRTANSDEIVTSVVSNTGILILQNGAGGGDNRTVDVYILRYCSGTIAWSAMVNNVRWRVAKYSGGSLAEVPPVVRAKYAIGSVSVVFGQNSLLTGSHFTKKVDTHSIWNGAGKFILPVAGTYLIRFSLFFSVTVSNNEVSALIRANGTYVESDDRGSKTTNQYDRRTAIAVDYFTQGTEIEFLVGCSEATFSTYADNGVGSRVEIVRIGS